MQNDDQPSETALTAAAARAAHLIVDGEPRVFDDPLAATLLGGRADELIDYHRRHGDHPILAGARTQATWRARHTEARAVHSGLDQYVILGAGLDSFAYRTTVHMRVFEVDHPASQRWKRQRLADAGIAEPATVRYLAVDFERDDLLAGLTAAGFDPTRPALVGWLGVSMYLTGTAIDRMLAQLGRLAPGSELVFDYFVPESMRDEDGRQYADQVGAMAAQRGERWQSVFTPAEVTQRLSRHGFTMVTHHAQHDAAELVGRTDALRPSTLARLAHARR